MEMLPKLTEPTNGLIYTQLNLGIIKTKRFVLHYQTIFCVKLISRTFLPIKWNLNTVSW